MEYEIVIVGALETNCILAYCPETRECAIVDPGADPELIVSAIAEKDLKPIVILNTHGHIDHTGANRDMKDKYRVPLRIHAADAPMLTKVQNVELGLLLGAKESPAADGFLKEGEAVIVGRHSFEVIHTPGHTPGSVSLRGGGLLLSGDTLFCGGVGRTDLPGGSARDLEDSLKRKLLNLDDDLHVLPGHGPTTTIGQERSSNPFLT